MQSFIFNDRITIPPCFFIVGCPRQGWTDPLILYLPEPYTPPLVEKKKAKVGIRDSIGTPPKAPIDPNCLKRLQQTIGFWRAVGNLFPPGKKCPSICTWLNLEYRTGDDIRKNIMPEEPGPPAQKPIDFTMNKIVF